MSSGSCPSSSASGVTGNDGIPPSIRQRVFKALDKNPLLTPKPLCILIGLDFHHYENYVKRLKHEWRRNQENERGSVRCFPDGVHSAFFKRVGWLVVRVPDCLPFGWLVSKCRNRYAVYRNGVGRVRWFRNGTVELFVRKPASVGRAMQLFCDAFTRTRLVNDIRVVEDFQRGLMRRAHFTFKAGHKLEYVRIQAFEDTHKFVMVAGDKTHPDCWEFMMEYQAEVVEARRLFELFEGLRDALGLGNSRSDVNGSVKPLTGDYSS